MKTPNMQTERDDPSAQLAMNTVFERTDIGNARRIVHHHGHELRYCYDLGSWFYWDKTRWVQDDNGIIERIAKRVPTYIRAEAQATPEEEKRNSLNRWAATSESKQRIDAMIALAKSDLEIVVKAKDLDRDPMLLNVLNGTLDLASCELRPHDPADLITKIAPVDYDAEAKCPKWLKFLSYIMADDEEMITFLQQAIGYSLSGSTSSQVMFFCYGLGANGKTTFLETIRYMLGDYAQKAPRGMLEIQRFDKIPNDLARLAGARFVVSSELSANKAFDEALIKDLTGGDTITARYLHKEFFEFTPTHKLWVYGNHKPRIDDTDDGIWRRVMLIPFTVTVPEEHRRPNLHLELREELSGILAWAVQGQRDAIQADSTIWLPEAVRAASEEFRKESDILGPFLDERCELGNPRTVTISKLYMAYQFWCERNLEQPMSKVEFGKNLSDRGFKKGRKSRERSWIGIGLKRNVQADADLELASDAFVDEGEV